MIFLPQETIAHKRDGLALTPGEIAQFIAGFADGSVSPAQAAAFAMAVYFRDMDLSERVALTEAMRDSGTVLDWSDLDGPVADKHSTGGVGDNVSLMLAPILAACGVYVPMISGRGLGHTGGTLDKFDSIPGYTTAPDNALFRKVVREAGCAIIGQTADLAPADKLLYGIRDVTATVESIPLITASILSKKLAAGLGALILDVKTGSGAFMQTLEKSKALAESLVGVANGAGLKTAAVITDMNQPLAHAAGNALEVRNAVEFLTGHGGLDNLYEVTFELSLQLLKLVGWEGGEASTKKLADVIHGGEPAERFARMVTGLGGPSDFIERMGDYLPRATIIRDVYPDDDGRVSEIDTRGVGMGVVALGGGRTRPTDGIDHAVGFDNLAAIGQSVGRGGRPLARLHANDAAAADDAERRLRAAYRLGGEIPDLTVIYDWIGPEESA